MSAHPPELSSLREAASYAGVSHQTVKNWCKRYGIGKLKGGRWHVSHPRLIMIMAAKQTLRRGA